LTATALLPYVTGNVAGEFRAKWIAVIMGLSTWKHKYRYEEAGWPLTRFAVLADEVQLSLGFDELSLDEGSDRYESMREGGSDKERLPRAHRIARLVRYYAGEGAMSRPGRDERDGREARYKFHHLVEFLVTRMLLKDGWPLSKVAEFVMSSAPEALEQMLPDDRMSMPVEPLTPAQLELRSIKRSMKRAEPRMQSLSKSVSSWSASRAPSSGDASKGFQEIPVEDMAALVSPHSASEHMISHQRAMSGSRSSLARLLHRIVPGEHHPAWKETMSVDLTPWCTVTFDADRLQDLPVDAFDTIGEALAQSLREQRMAKRRERK
jgi:hypothetical protein